MDMETILVIITIIIFLIGLFLGIFGIIMSKKTEKKD